MSTRTYDVILTVDSATAFQRGNVLVGNTTGTVGTIAGIDTTANLIKVKLANVIQEFSDTEYVHSNVINISGTANGALNSTSLPFQANTMSGNTMTAVALVSAVAPSNFIAEKNAFTQNPIVRLYSIYYPGEWYPPNEAGNPTGDGEGRAWPNGFPYQFAEIIGDTAEDLLYNVTYGGTSYAPFPISITTVEQSSEGRINELTVTIFNGDNLISAIVEDPFISGNNISNSVLAHVNGELVHGIDPRTVNINPASLPAGTQRDLLTAARNQGLAYSSTIENEYGTANASFTRDQTISVNGTWRRNKLDSRDILGGVVEIKTTFANFLDHWPEYSIVTSVDTVNITVKNALPYRIGDTVRSSRGIDTGVITAIDNDTLVLDSALTVGTTADDAIYIVNADADPESYLEDKYKINQLESMSEFIASFGLVSWLQYFKITAPKRKYYKNTCQWKYKGVECQYPESGTGTIRTIGGSTITANGYFTASNESTINASEDVCAKSFAACRLRNNTINFGAFPGVGRSIPRS
jgi:phage-related protein